LAEAGGELFGMDETPDGGGGFRRIVGVEMVQQQIQTARVEVRVVPRKKHVAGAVRMAEDVEHQSGRAFRV